MGRTRREASLTALMKQSRSGCEWGVLNSCINEMGRFFNEMGRFFFQRNVPFR